MGVTIHFSNVPKIKTKLILIPKKPYNNFYAIFSIYWDNFVAKIFRMSMHRNEIWLCRVCSVLRITFRKIVEKLFFTTISESTGILIPVLKNIFAINVVLYRCDAPECTNSASLTMIGWTVFKLFIIKIGDAPKTSKNTVKYFYVSIFLCKLIKAYYSPNRRFQVTSELRNFKIKF